MKTRLLSLVLVLFLLFNSAKANIWRVNGTSNFNGSTLFGDNQGGTAAYPVFQQLNQANGWASVANGDTLYIEPAPAVYNLATITKKLVIIGPGYFLNENPKVSNTVLDAKLATLIFSTGSAGSQLIGINMVSAGNTGNRIYMNVNNLVIKRCRIELNIELGTAVSNAIIIQNFFPSTGSTNAIATNGNVYYVYPTDIYFNNNICQKTLLWNGTILQCNNNVFDGPANKLNIQMLTSSFQNNILKSTNATVNINNNANTNVSYNIGNSAAQFGTSTNNVVVADMSSLFVATGTTDGIYQLKGGSAGSNNGSDGADRGAFGGSAVTRQYTLSGLAPVPVIYDIATSGVAGPTGLPVTIKARTIK